MSPSGRPIERSTRNMDLSGGIGTEGRNMMEKKTKENEEEKRQDQDEDQF